MTQAQAQALIVLALEAYFATTADPTAIEIEAIHDLFLSHVTKVGATQ